MKSNVSQLLILLQHTGGSAATQIAHLIGSVILHIVSGSQ